MRPRRFSVTGPGLKKALQEAINAGKQLETLFDYDESGTILRFGYRLFNKGQPRDQRNEIIWFKPGEVEVTYED